MEESRSPDSGSDNEEEDETNTQLMIKEMGDNPLMDRVQTALFNQLSGEKRTISLELREKEEELRRLKLRREDIGVELYGVQQHLSSLQTNLEQGFSTFNKIAELRGNAEKAVQSLRMQNNDSRSSVKENQQALLKAQSELDSLNNVLRQITSFNEQMESDVEAARRAAHKAEENVSTLEKSKQQQDYYIYTLSEQLRELQEQLALFDVQIGSQRKETSSSQDTLKTAAKDMEAISFEKKQLLLQWKSSLIGMQKRDEALQAAQRAIKQQQEDILSLVTEVEGYKKAVQKEQEENEKLSATKDKVDAEIKFVDEQLAKVQAEREKLAERYDMLQKSLSQTEEEASKIVIHTNGLRNEITSVEKSIEVVHRERQKIEQDIMDVQNQRMTADKASKSLVKASMQIQAKTHEKEIEKANLQNELARLKVDTLNKESHNIQLKETVEKAIQELRDKETRIEKSELEIRQRNDEIEKKMNRVARLNRKYEQLVARMEDGPETGPFEATIKSIKKEIAGTQEDSSNLQRDWLQVQTHLVSLTADSEKVLEANQQLSSRLSILQQKRMRLFQSISHMQGEIKDHRSAITVLHNDMMKLNELIAKNTALRETLSNSNFGMELEFLNELKELEAESVGLEQQVENLRSQKKLALDEIMEAEKQVMLWEKKIQLERETQAALDPEIGQAEVKQMEKEIHRMRIRLDTLRREQEAMIQEMEQAIYKRDTIASKFKGQKNSEATQAAIIKKVGALKSELGLLSKEANFQDAQVQEKLEIIDKISREQERISREYAQSEGHTNHLQKILNDIIFQRQRNSEQLSRYQKLARRLESINAGKLQSYRHADAIKIEAELAAAEKNAAELFGIINVLTELFPHVENACQKVANYKLSL